MNGYVKNISRDWSYIMKRTVRPGGEIPVDELYEQYGEKHGIAEGDAFVDWLANVKLRNNGKFKLVFEPSDKEVGKEIGKVPKSAVGSDSGVAPMVTKGLQVEDIVGLSVRKARVEVKKMTDVKLLKYALEEANQMTDKESLCRILRKQIKDVSANR